MSLTVGVAMATFNGERYLDDQLRSIAAQTRPPDRLVVHDDCSSDGTVKIIRSFSGSAPFPVRCVEGTERIGYPDAFVDAARRCETDVIAFCDQDDVWQPEKLDRCAQEFGRFPDATLMAHSWVVLGGSRFQRTRYRRRLVTGPTATPLTWPPGFAMLIPRRVLEFSDAIRERRPIGESGWAHDDWFTFLGAALGTAVFLPDQLVLYRQHEHNVLGASREYLSQRIFRSAAERGEEHALYSAIAQWAEDSVETLNRLGDLTSREPGRFPGARPQARVPLFERAGRVNERRATLYASGGTAGARAGSLMAHINEGDYGRRTRGGLGISSLLRDVLHTSGALDALAGMLR